MNSDMCNSPVAALHLFTESAIDPQPSELGVQSHFQNAGFWVQKGIEGTPDGLYSEEQPLMGAFITAAIPFTEHLVDVT